MHVISALRQKYESAQESIDCWACRSRPRSTMCDLVALKFKKALAETSARVLDTDPFVTTPIRNCCRSRMIRVAATF